MSEMNVLQVAYAKYQAQLIANMHNDTVKWERELCTPSFWSQATIENRHFNAEDLVLYWIRTDQLPKEIPAFFLAQWHSVKK